MSQNYVIRELKIEELDKMVLITEKIQDYFNSYQEDKEINNKIDVYNFLQTAIRNPYQLCLCAEINNEFVGIGVMSIRPCYKKIDDLEAIEHLLNVIPDLSKRVRVVILKEMYKQMEEFAMKKNVKDIICQSPVWSPLKKHFKSIGYREKYIIFRRVINNGN